MPRKIPGARVQMTNVYLPERVAVKLQLLLMDPRSKKVRWGAWQALVEKLVTDWVEKQVLDHTEADTLSVTPHRALAAAIQHWPGYTPKG